MLFIVILKIWVGGGKQNVEKLIFGENQSFMYLVFVM